MYKRIALVGYSTSLIAHRANTLISITTTAIHRSPGLSTNTTASSLRPSTSTHPLFQGNTSPTVRTYTSETTTTIEHTRILEVIKQEHRELISHVHKIIASTNPDEQTRFQNQLTWELARHLIGEELVVYPALITYLKSGQALADEGRTEHQDLKEQLKMFQGLRSTDPRFIPTLKALEGDLENHIRKEEDLDFARLEATISREDSEALSRSLARTKMFLPSRSHPLAPSKPPFETALGLLMAPVDIVADMFRKWPHPGEDGKGKMSGSR